MLSKKRYNEEKIYKIGVFLKKRNFKSERPALNKADTEERRGSREKERRGSKMGRSAGEGQRWPEFQE